MSAWTISLLLEQLWIKNCSSKGKLSWKPLSSKHEQFVRILGWILVLHQCWKITLRSSGAVSSDLGGQVTLLWLWNVPLLLIHRVAINFTIWDSQEVNRLLVKGVILHSQVQGQGIKSISAGSVQANSSTTLNPRGGKCMVCLFYWCYRWAAPWMAFGPKNGGQQVNAGLTGYNCTHCVPQTGCGLPRTEGLSMNQHSLRGLAGLSQGWVSASCQALWHLCAIRTAGLALITCQFIMFSYLFCSHRTKVFHSLCQV